ncbi:hypothetical protein GCM10009808_06960 [Microbacterium sediminicola]|uniref:Uncharacterized protein n=1 Tax=Microbacterium sediminicola TaxID=415210 RepID=A0ABP4TRE0_9MICO
MRPEVVVPIVVGLGAIVIGILLVKYRKQARDFVIKSEAPIVGKSRAQRWGRLQTPFWAGAVGVGWVGVGLLAITFAIVRLIAGA